MPQPPAQFGLGGASRFEGPLHIHRDEDDEEEHVCLREKSVSVVPIQVNTPAGQSRFSTLSRRGRAYRVLMDMRALP